VYANSLIGVGIASSLYHASRGKLRKYLRWVDYTMIATTTIVSSTLLNPSPNSSLTKYNRLNLVMWTVSLKGSKE